MKYAPSERHFDPGVEGARARGEAALSLVGPSRDAGPSAGNGILVGTAGWTDRTLTARGVFYPTSATTAEARLRYYASHFSMVEVDATYYALPVPQMAEHWVARTPDDFVFDVKAFALMTGHPAEVTRLPADLRSALPPDIRAKTRVYSKDLPRDVRDAVWAAFRDGIHPLHHAGKLGAVLLQYPRWFLPSAAAKDMILEARDRLEGLPCAVEFRNRRWFTPQTSARTLQFLSDHALPFVVVDEPQGLESSVPPIVDVTSPALAIVRLHGHRDDLWEKSGVSTVERYRYLYDERELTEWVPRVRSLAGKATATHVVFNNCYANYGTTNALEMQALLVSDR
jgi:uncharacterized protein YecE (DUF72 family)